MAGNQDDIQLYEGTVTLSSVFRHFGIEEYGTVAVGTAITSYAGFRAGNNQARIPMAWGAAFIGFTGALSYCVLRKTEERKF
eukprot:gene10877-2953_t